MATTLKNSQDALVHALRQTEGQFESLYDRARVMSYLLQEQSFDIEAAGDDRRRAQRSF